MVAMYRRAPIRCDPATEDLVKATGDLRIWGMRITVYDVLGYMATGMTREEMLEDFPDLTMDDLLACLAYAADRDRRTIIVSTT